MKSSPFAAIAIFVLSFSPAAALRALELNSLFSENAVLQQEMPVPVWGTAQAGEEITVTFADQEKSTKTAPDGSCMVVLDPLVACAKPPVATAIEANNRKDRGRANMDEQFVGLPKVVDRSTAGADGTWNGH